KCTSEAKVTLFFRNYKENAGIITHYELRITNYLNAQCAIIAELLSAILEDIKDIYHSIL
ncbi:MAG: hypothetical protein J6A01_08050, partial [Proteobacteria bacterium]|nr:hypothetical protein [Pseudomonadota bacterium]